MQKILVIDDEEIFRQATACALQRKGFETHEASDGAEGAVKARHLLPDLIICDVNMDNMDGYTLLETLRGEPATATIPLILMTGMGDASSMRRGMNLGADDYLSKPFTAPQLFSAVEARLKKSQVLRQNAEKKLADLRANLSLALPHEMITPLNGIFGLAQILSADSESLTPAEVAEFGTNILQSAERLHRTVQNFLLYGQLEMQASDSQSDAALRQKETGQVKLLVETRARHLAEKANRIADLEMDLADGSLSIGQDLFTKLVDELVDNAFKFSVAGTTVRVTSSFKNGNFAFSVSDRGHGMGADQIAGIGAYSQFNRKTHEQQGSGLGLAIARRIAELHGGGLNVESQCDLGTTVTFKLPV
jgi:two-component system, sensor histidine kinase and response regulator